MLVPATCLERVTSIYSDKYADVYDGYYLYPWADKHRVNIEYVGRLLATGLGRRRRWLDLCCGQAWHFSQISGDLEKVGVDVSGPHLERARRRNPGAEFVRADVLTVELGPRCFDLVTCFWAAYCYLGSAARIDALLARTITWACPKGGAVYFEVLLPEDVMTFNESEYARRTGFRVHPQTPDCTVWCYEDIGGQHIMASPPLSLFLEAFERASWNVTTTHDRGFMTHLIARAIDY